MKFRKFVVFFLFLVYNCLIIRYIYDLDRPQIIHLFPCRNRPNSILTYSNVKYNANVI